MDEALKIGRLGKDVNLGVLNRIDEDSRVVSASVKNSYHFNANPLFLPPFGKIT